MVGGGNRRDEASFTVSNTNVFAALDSLRKKKKSDKDKSSSRGGKGTSKGAARGPSAEAQKQANLEKALDEVKEYNQRQIQGLLRGGGSSRRKTPVAEISHPLPSNAAWRQVSLCSGNGQKEKLYAQAWSDMDEPLCKLCQTPCKGNNAKIPQFFEDLFCRLDCLEEYRSRTSNRFLREGLFQIEHGICTNCGVNCHQLVKHLKVLALEKREAYIKKFAPIIGDRDKLLAKLLNDPTEGNAWHAGHIIPVYKGGEM